MKNKTKINKVYITGKHIKETFKGLKANKKAKAKAKGKPRSKSPKPALVAVPCRVLLTLLRQFSIALFGNA